MTNKEEVKPKENIFPLIVIALIALMAIALVIIDLTDPSKKELKMERDYYKQQTETLCLITNLQNDMINTSIKYIPYAEEYDLKSLMPGKIDCDGLILK